MTAIPPIQRHLRRGTAGRERRQPDQHHHRNRRSQPRPHRRVPRLNETVSSSNTRLHADDTRYGNFDHVSDMVGIVDGRSGQQIIGTYNAATATGADATFSAATRSITVSGYTTGTTTVGAVNGSSATTPPWAPTSPSTRARCTTSLRGNTTGADTAQLRQSTTEIGNTTGFRHGGGSGSTPTAAATTSASPADDGFGSTSPARRWPCSTTSGRQPPASTATSVPPASAAHRKHRDWEQGGKRLAACRSEARGEADTAYKTLGTDGFALFTHEQRADPQRASGHHRRSETRTRLAGLHRRAAHRFGGQRRHQLADGRDNIAAGSGNDIVHGGTAADIGIAEGAGNDTDRRSRRDTFKRNLGDASTTMKPAVDLITDRCCTSPAITTSGGDVLDLRDLLPGTHRLSQRQPRRAIRFEKSGARWIMSGTNSGYTGGSFVASHRQKIVLQGVDLTSLAPCPTTRRSFQDRLLVKGQTQRRLKRRRRIVRLGRDNSPCRKRASSIGR